MFKFSAAWLLNCMLSEKYKETFERQSKSGENGMYPFCEFTAVQQWNAGNWA